MLMRQRRSLADTSQWKPMADGPPWLKVDLTWLQIRFSNYAYFFPCYCVPSFHPTKWLDIKCQHHLIKRSSGLSNGLFVDSSFTLWSFVALSSRINKPDSHVMRISSKEVKVNSDNLVRRARSFSVAGYSDSGLIVRMRSSSFTFVHAVFSN